jgi:hypothetical protein
MKKFDKVKDSGSRQQFHTGSKRDTNEGKPRFDLITPIGLHRLAMHYANGAKKYGDRNWEKGQPLSRYIESAERHLFKMKLGYTDEDHESALVWNILGYIHTKTMIETGVLSKELDDMPKYNDKLRKMFE